MNLGFGAERRQPFIEDLTEGSSFYCFVGVDSTFWKRPSIVFWSLKVAAGVLFQNTTRPPHWAEAAIRSSAAY